MVVAWLCGILLVALAVSVAWRARSAYGRAKLRGHWLRSVRWEYWPPWAIYAPIVPVLAWRSLRYGGLRSATCVNPKIPLGGLVGESKSQILALIGGREEVARWHLVQSGTLEERTGVAEGFAAALPADTAVVLKPDRGERGTGVRITRTAGQREAALREITIAVLAQEYVAGVEFGVFWYRPPGAERGDVFSITHKMMVSVRGDGKRTIEELIFAEDRLLPMLDLHLKRFAGRLDEVPSAGEEIQVTWLGTHALGATFLDANHLRTPALADALDAIMQGSGLDFGRFDLRVPDETGLAAGRDLRLLEFNGLSAEATHIYDPTRSLGAARATLLEQWTLALRVGHANRQAGRRKPASWAEIWRALCAHRADRAERGA